MWGLLPETLPGIVIEFVFKAQSIIEAPRPFNLELEIGGHQSSPGYRSVFTFPYFFIVVVIVVDVYLPFPTPHPLNTLDMHFRREALGSISDKECYLSKANINEICRNMRYDDII